MREYAVGIEVVVGFLIAWVARKARRVAQRADSEVDTACGGVFAGA
jgi:hypothetical protein